MKILIVEDEQHEREFLERILKKNPLATEIRSAADGRAFVRKALEWNPETVFLDIKIPEQNGLDALEELRSKGFQGQVIVLSAYDFFEYAQYAVTLGVSQYLLKPAGEDEIFRALEKVHQKIRRKALQRENRHALQHFMETHGGEAFKTILEKVLLREELPRESLHVLEELGFSPHQRIFLLGMLLPDQGGSSPRSLLETRKAIRQLLPREILAVPWSSRLLFLVGPCRAELSLEETLLSLGEFFSENRISPNILYEEHLPGLEELARIMPAMERDLEDSLLMGKGLVSSREAFLNEELHHLPSSFQDRQKYRFERHHLLDLFKNARDPQLQSSMWSFFGELAQHLGTPCANMTIKGLLLSMLDYCFAMNCPEPAYTSLGRQIFASPPWEHAHAEDHGEFLHLLDQLFAMRRLLQDKNAALVGEVTEFIQNNIDSASLESAARQISVSPQYLSRLFHSVSGKKFIDLVKELRMEEAKKLLLRGISVRDTAISVGYGNISYFSLTFKNHTGLSPRDFAKQHVIP